MKAYREREALTSKDYEEFIEAKTDKQRIEILIIHSQKNEKYKRRKTMENYNLSAVISQEEISKQFEEFCKTKGIVAKFKVAFEQMGENAKMQHKQDKANIEAIKNSQENKEFREFLHTKGFKAKCKLVIENMKKGAIKASEENKKKLENQYKQTQGKTNAHKVRAKVGDEYSAKELCDEFNAFLKEQGLDGKYFIEIVEK